MKVDFKQVAAVLYQEFGDQGIAWVKEQASGYFAEKHTPAAEEDSENGEQGDGPLEDGPPGSDETSHDYDIYDDADAFSAELDANVHKLSTSSITSPDHVVQVVMGLVVMAGEVRKFEEAQVTKRVGIAADRDVAIATIKAQHELLQSYLDRTFDERATGFTKLFAVVDHALETHNMAALAMGLESVIKLATSSPFKDLRTVEETAAALADPAHEWDF